MQKKKKMLFKLHHTKEIHYVDVYMIGGVDRLLLFNTDLGFVNVNK